MAARFPCVSPQLAARYRAAGYWRDVLCDAALQRAASDHGDATALVDRRGPIGWGELADRVRATAAGLASLGIAHRDVVSWILPNWREAAIVHWAVLSLGAISNPIVPIYRQREVGRILGQAGSKLIVAPSSYRGFGYADMLAELRGSLPALASVVTVDGAGGDLGFDELCETSPGAPPNAAPDRSPDDPALLLFTSGTTADPKGAVHTHNTLDFEIRSMIDFYGLGAGDVVYMPSPLTHVTGLLYGIQMPAVLGSSVVYQDRFEVDEAMDLLVAHGCSFSVGATPFLHGITEAQKQAPRDLSLHTFVCGGADVPPALIREASAALRCTATRAYGSTEFPTVTGGTAADSEERRSETDGRVMAHCEVKVVNDAGIEVAPGVAGELIARGPELFPGYLDGVGAEAFDAEGWFATGDLVSVRDGFLTVVGRKKDIIIRGGENISVKEVEDLLFAHPDVMEVAVVAMPDPAMGERACAYVVPAPGATPKLGTLTALLRGSGLATQKFPERLEVVDELPRTASGKVQKNVLRDRIRNLIESE
ncbi:MAG: AMP-binding protein [Myxococcales bacterium]|nr:AMP-binding protein [Myxococcales bacterium]